MIASMGVSNSFPKKVILDYRKKFHLILKLKEVIMINLTLNLILGQVPMPTFKNLLDSKMIILQSKIYYKEKFLVKRQTNVLQILIKLKRPIFIKIPRILLSCRMMHMEILAIL